MDSPLLERLIGSIRRGCLDRLIVLNELRFHRIAGPTSIASPTSERISRVIETRRSHEIPSHR